MTAKAQHVGTTLRMLRVDAGLSVRSLAKQIGVSSAYLSRVENGRDPAPTPERLIALAEALDLPAGLLLELAHQTGAALKGYLDRVPAANGFFLEVARRDLDSNQLSELREFMQARFGPTQTAKSAPIPLRKLVGSRMVLGADCATVEEAIELGAARLVRSARRASEITGAILARERSFSTVLGRGVCVPHAITQCVPSATATLVTLNTPIACDTPDGISVRVVFVLASPAAGTEHLEALAEIARLASHHLIDRVHAAAKPSQVRAVFRELESAAA